MSLPWPISQNHFGQGTTNAAKPPGGPVNAWTVSWGDCQPSAKLNRFQGGIFMNHFIKRGLVTAVATGAFVAIGAGSALADDCVNLSRNTNPAQAAKGAKTLDTPFGPTSVKGHWVYLGDVWLLVTPGTESLLDGAVDTSGLPGAKGNFTNGKGDGLLEQSGTASGGRRCAVMENGHGIAGECGEDSEPQ
jgi:hypothetical protein